MLRIKFQYNFHPVGQGLFCSGVLQQKRQPDFAWVFDCGSSKKCSLLYGGDGYLDTAKKHDRLADFLSSERIEKLAGFQVNHHGASGNWHSGLAQKLDPEFSFFCADPKRGKPGHPHDQVLKDYADHKPVIINRTGGAIAGHCTN